MNSAQGNHSRFRATAVSGVNGGLNSRLRSSSQSSLDTSRSPKSGAQPRSPPRRTEGGVKTAVTVEEQPPLIQEPAFARPAVYAGFGADNHWARASVQVGERNDWNPPWPRKAPRRQGVLFLFRDPPHWRGLAIMGASPTQTVRAEWEASGSHGAGVATGLEPCVAENQK